MTNSTAIKMETIWNTFQESRCHDNYPNSYLILLSALDQGWTIVKTELAPSWDQHGFIYLVTLKRWPYQHSHQLVLPQDALIASLLQERSGAIPPILSDTH